MFPMARRFDYDVDDRYRWLWRLFGLRPDRDAVTLTDDGRLVATFGRFRLETDLANVDGAHVTEGYRWWKSVGARLSLADDGLTFGTNARRGVCVHFAERVPHVVGFRDHSAITVTVADCDGLVAALAS